jgi:hypothetical protein
MRLGLGMVPLLWSLFPCDLSLSQNELGTDDFPKLFRHDLKSGFHFGIGIRVAPQP